MLTCAGTGNAGASFVVSGGRKLIAVSVDEATLFVLSAGVSICFVVVVIVVVVLGVTGTVNVFCDVPVLPVE